MQEKATGKKGKKTLSGAISANVTKFINTIAERNFQVKNTYQRL